MKLQTLNGQTSYQGLTIEKPISKILVCNATSDAIDQLITIDIVSKSGSQRNIYRKAILVDIAELSQEGEGYNMVSVNAVDGYYSVMQIDLSDGLGVELMNDEQIVISIENCNAAHTLHVFGIETPIYGRVVNKYNFNSIVTTNPTSRTINVNDNTSAIAVNLNTGFDKITLNFGGISCTYTKPELRQLMRDKNDLVFAADVLIEGDAVAQSVFAGATKYGRLSIPPQCTSVELFTTNTTLEYVIIERQTL